MPERIQLRRTKGWRLPENTVKVTRPGRWGNPFSVHPQHEPGRAWGISGQKTYSVPTAADAVECFREMMTMSPERMVAVSELRGKNLACFCKIGEPCHADVLLELANPSDEGGKR